ncbi:arylesterase [Sphingomonas sp.]|uniref:arylesterase n=1 Tax=Sphingomonas sp. TaxID=28214 RepID=UPI00286D34DB|nr:arylesterase [Sphingomonas sp.]
MRFLPVLLLAVAGSTASAAPVAKPLILAYGDSLTAGYNLDRGLGFAPQLQATLRRHGIAATVADGGVSGDTTTGGRARLGWTLDGLPRTPDLAIVELGGNDMLRTIDPAITRANLDAILAELDRRHIPVLLAGMRAAPNLDTAYRAKFDAIYPGLAKAHRAALYPFFLDGVAGQAGMQQADGVHPTFAGVKRIVTGILPRLLAALGR